MKGLLLLSYLLLPAIAPTGFASRIHHFLADVAGGRYLGSGSGYATRYGWPDDRDDQGTPACYRRCLRVTPGGNCAEKFSDDLFSREYPRRCASRTLPCGTRVVIAYKGNLTTCTVLDRGPYGALLPDGRYVVKRKRSGPGRWRGALDLTPAVADAAGLTRRTGRAKLRYWVFVPPSRGPAVARPGHRRRGPNT